ncbi:MAG TPA: M28 family peptidase, partial [Caulobacteraceae bacterium]|nr:M28 family peptidase [Caulobacteraceae bacterium]
MGPKFKIAAALAVYALAGSAALAQPPARPAPAAPRTTVWFGVPTPGPISDWTKPTFASNPDAYGMPAPRWARPTPAPLAGAKLMADVRTIVGFARERKDAGDPLWGRISGLPGEPKTVEWAIGRMKAAGIANAHTEAFKVDRPLYVPTKWEVRIKSDESFGAGTRDVVLQSAMPLATAKTTAQPVSGQLVFIGRGSPAELANVDLKGKIAVVNVVPDGSLFASREKGVAREAVARGAIGVINAVESPGNLLFFDSRYGCGDAPCFTVGGDDGAFLEAIIGRAAAAGKSAQLRAQLSVASEVRTNLTALNGVAVIPGKSSEIVIVNAHADSWFEGADDNADGLSVLVGLAEYYAKRGKPDRTILFMVSGGHHTGNGPAAFIAAHPEIIRNTVLVMNLEHLAQIAVAQAPRLDPGASGYGSGVWVASTAETVKQAGAANTTPYVMELMGRAARQFGVVTVFQPTQSVPGD